MYSWLYFVPKNLISYWVGILMHLPLPPRLAQWSIRQFAHHFKINIDEAELSLDQYKNIGDFFVRKLKPGLRPIADGFYVHPADSNLTQRGVISKNTLLQAKGRIYSLQEFLQEAFDNSYDGGFYLTYYLCPTDYHRVHSPVSGKIKRVIYIPGNLWPVNDWSVNNVDRAFAVNERLVVEIETIKGTISVVLVGALNVGSMTLSFDETVKTNHSHVREKRVIEYADQPIEKGQELGAFRMGSTVVVVAPKSFDELAPYVQSQERRSVQVGSAG